MSYPAEKRYKAKAYDNISVVVPKGARDFLRQKCEAEGKTVNGLVNDLLREYIGIAPEDWNYKHFADFANSADAGRADE